MYNPVEPCIVMYSLYSRFALYILAWAPDDSYAMLSSGVPWNIPRVTCIFFVHTAATRAIFFLEIVASPARGGGYTSDKVCDFVAKS